MKTKLPYAPAHSIQEYFNLPKKDRYKYGFYLKPYALPLNDFENRDDKNGGGWAEFNDKIKKLHPIQYFIRENLSDFYSKIFGQFGIIEDIRQEYIYYFAPRQDDIRKAIPRTWCDKTELIRIINFEIIKSFYKEANESFVDWNSDDEHIAFKFQLDDNYNYITKLRPELEKQLSNSYPRGEQRKLPYEEAYFEVNGLEKIIEEHDTEIMLWTIKNRGFFWT